jgi:hypothetical protein
MAETQARTRPCEICGSPIEQERVEVLPATRLCAKHAREIRKYGGEFTITITVERLNKSGSLKRNYGGITPHRRRNGEAIAKLREAFEAEQARKENVAGG